MAAVAVLRDGTAEWVATVAQQSAAPSRLAIPLSSLRKLRIADERGREMRCKRDRVCVSDPHVRRRVRASVYERLACGCVRRGDAYTYSALLCTEAPTRHGVARRPNGLSVRIAWGERMPPSRIGRIQGTDSHPPVGHLPSTLTDAGRVQVCFRGNGGSSTRSLHTTLRLYGVEVVHVWFAPCEGTAEGEVTGFESLPRQASTSLRYTPDWTL
ncbi:hypothetical protein C8R47DRAFT_1193448 [Mycena vitilis]|nr:hypothetical protein C8R47DRAFT_1193448 [Mycena vitilis]